MSLRDDQLIEAVIKMHEAASVVYRDVGDGKLSADIRNCADRLSDLLKLEIPTGK